MKLTCLIFRLGHCTFGMEVGSISEVVRPRQTTPVPEMTEFLSGVIKVRGEMVPLVDMRKRLGVAPEPAKDRVIIVRTSVGKIGLHVDEARGVMAFNEDDMRKPPVMFRGLKRKFLLGLHDIEGGVMLVLDIHNLLSSDEKIAIEKATKGAARL